MTLGEKNGLKIGDVVRLNSGGNKMTVQEIQNNVVTCLTWNEHEQRVMYGCQNIDYRLLKIEQSQ